MFDQCLHGFVLRCEIGEITQAKRSFVMVQLALIPKITGCPEGAKVLILYFAARGCDAERSLRQTRLAALRQLSNVQQCLNIVINKSLEQRLLTEPLVADCVKFRHG